MVATPRCFASHVQEGMRRRTVTWAMLAPTMSACMV